MKRVNTSCQEINKVKRAKLTNDYIAPPLCDKPIPTLSDSFLPSPTSTTTDHVSPFLTMKKTTEIVFPETRLNERIPKIIIEKTPKEYTPSQNTQFDSDLNELATVLQKYLHETFENHKATMSGLLEDHRAQVDSHLAKVKKLMEDIIQEFNPMEKHAVHL